MKTAKEFLMEGLDNHGACFDENFIDDSEYAWDGVIEGSEKYAEYVLEEYKKSLKK